MYLLFGCFGFPPPLMDLSHHVIPTAERVGYMASPFGQRATQNLAQAELLLVLLYLIIRNQSFLGSHSPQWLPPTFLSWLQVGSVTTPLVPPSCLSHLPSPMTRSILPLSVPTSLHKSPSNSSSLAGEWKVAGNTILIHSTLLKVSRKPPLNTAILPAPSHHPAFGFQTVITITSSGLPFHAPHPLASDSQGAPGQLVFHFLLHLTHFQSPVRQWDSVF